MGQHDITPDMNVWNVIEDHPETIEVFKRHGCPDMSSGFFAMTAHVMKVKWAAKVHGIELESLLTDLNLAIHPEEDEGTLH